MSKSKSILAIVLIVLCAAFFGYMDYAGIGKDKAGSASEIKLGLDLAGGVSITYQAVGEEEPSSQDPATSDKTLYSPEGRRIIGYLATDEEGRFPDRVVRITLLDTETESNVIEHT